MKDFLIIPMGGKGKRFIKAGYKTYKPFLPVSKSSNIIDNIINNFSNKKISVILIGNKKKIKRYKIKKQIKIINIKNHNKGPLYSIYLAKDKIKEIVKKNRIFICYSDINWKWNKNEIFNYLKKKKSVIFTHTGFHPHLEVDQKSDFCLLNRKKLINNIKQKKTHFNDYKKEFLAIGCYFFQNFDLIYNDINNFNYLRNKKKEFYLVSLIQLLLKRKIPIFSKEIKKFVHLGNPQQYEDFLYWKKIVNIFLNSTINFKNKNNVMLMAGKGKRVKNLPEQKPFLKIRKEFAFEYILKKYGAKKNIIITNSKYFKRINNPKYVVNKINNTNSMFSTFLNSRKYLNNCKSFFLLSCDCFGSIDNKKFKLFLDQNNPDIVVFGFKFTNLQKNLFQSHTELIIKRNFLLNINVKNSSSQSQIGHAGFFWLKNNDVFKNLENFKNFAKNNIKKREILVDDYFSYLHKFNLMKVNYYPLDYYVHFGSLPEYYELQYWDNYFK